LPDFLKEQQKNKADLLQQTMVTNHFAKAEPQEKIIPYSDELFKQAAVEWLIATDQVRVFPIHFPFMESLSLNPSRFKLCNILNFKK